MSILKFAYVRGAQNALVSAGAIDPYANEFNADLAVKLAAMAIEDDAADEVSDEELAQAMAALSSNAEEELTPEEVAQVMEAAEEGKEELKEVIESMQDEESAKEVVAYLKQAAAGHFQGGVANPKPVNPGDYEQDSRAPGAYHMNGKNGPLVGDYNATPSTASMQSLREGITPQVAGKKKNDLDAKTAAAILRKLGGTAALGGDAGELLSQEDKQDDGRAENYAVNATVGNSTGKSNSTPGNAEMLAHDEDTPANKLDHENDSKTKSAAYNYLLYKTAEEVGPFLPDELNETDKLAALRTMIGMSQPERAEYIQRIKWAMEDSESKDEDEDSKDKKDSDEDNLKKLPEGLQKAIKKKKEAEKEASYILRQLGLGY